MWYRRRRSPQTRSTEIAFGLSRWWRAGRPGSSPELRCQALSLLSPSISPTSRLNDCMIYKPPHQLYPVYPIPGRPARHHRERPNAISVDCVCGLLLRLYHTVSLPSSQLPSFHGSPMMIPYPACPPPSITTVLGSLISETSWHCAQ